MKIGLRFTSRWAALFLALSLPATSDAQTIGGTRSGGASAGGAATHQRSSGASSQPESGQRSVPLNGQGEPINMEGTPAMDNSKASRRLRRPAYGNQNPVPTGPASDPIREQSIRKDCVMAADPADCRERARQGLTDDSIERDPP